MITIEGAVPPQTKDFHFQSLRDELSAFGPDILGFWSAAPGVSYPATLGIGDAVGKFDPMIARRRANGTRAKGNGNGAILQNVAGLNSLDVTANTVEIKATPTDRKNFGFGLLLYLSETFLAAPTKILFGNAESGGAFVAHGISRAVGSGMDSVIAWGGITNTWMGEQTPLTQTLVKVTQPGWYSLAVDRVGDVTGLAIDDRPVITTPYTINAPTLTSSYIGNNTPTGHNSGQIAMGAILACAGPLAQSPTRLAQWRKMVVNLKSALAA